MGPLRRERSRFTRTGVLFTIIGALTILPAWNTGNNLLYLLSGGFYSVIIVSWIACRIEVYRLSMTREAPHAVHRGEAFAMTVIMANRKRLLPALSLRVEPSVASDRARLFVLVLPAGNAVTLRVSDTIAKRGVHPLPDIRVASGFPFGLIEASAVLSDNREILVYPRITPLRILGFESSAGHGDVRQSVKSDGSEYFSLRDYVPGDDLRRIAWRASARLGNLIVKELEHEAVRFVTIVFDARYDAVAADGQFQPDEDDPFEQTVELGASLAVTLLQRQYSVAIVSNDRVLLEGEGAGQSLRILEFFARIVPLPLDAPDVYGKIMPLETAHTTYVCLNANPDSWGTVAPVGRVLHPRELVRA
jgi:uncharacterized protein (DUF58 family)